MLLRCSRVQPTMMDGPWVDKPQSITEAELTALESNYTSMLKSIREDTFGGQLPPKYNPNQMPNITTNHKEPPMSFQFGRDLHGERIHYMNTNESIHIYNDDDDQAMGRTESGLDISFTHSVNESALSVPGRGPNRLSHLQFLTNTDHRASRIDPDRNTLSEEKDEDDEQSSGLGRRFREAFESAEINLSVQRVRMQLNMTASPTIDMSPIPPSRDQSIIDVDVNQIAETMERNSGLSLPFMSPNPNESDVTVQASNRAMRRDREMQRDQRMQREREESARMSRLQFVAQSASPPNIPAFGRRHSSEDPQSSSAQLGPMNRRLFPNSPMMRSPTLSTSLSFLSSTAESD